MYNDTKQKKSNLKHSSFKKEKTNETTKKPLIIVKNYIKEVIINEERRNALVPRGKEIDKEYVFNFLKKTPGFRSYKDLPIVAEYLSNNYEYFTKIKNEEGMGLLVNITKISRLEIFIKDSTIIKFDDIGDKFYIVLKGKVEVFKPKFIEKEETPNNFLKLLKKIKDIEDNEGKYWRLKNKNADFFKHLPNKIINNKNKSKNKKKIIFQNELDEMELKQLFYFEIDEKMGEYGEGFSFGEIALIKQAPRNATIKAKDDCILLSIRNDEYNKALLEFQKKKLSKQIENFLQSFPFFRDFDNDKIIRLFNCFVKKELYKGDFLYKQNMDANSIYVLNSGSFIVYSYISFPWINDYINYMDYSRNNILNFLIENRNIKYEDLMKLFQNSRGKIRPKKESYGKFENFYELNESQMKDNLYILKRDEEKLNSSEYIFKLNLNKVDYKDVLGIEEVFEFKKRFCYYKCISEKAELKEIKIKDFLRLIISMTTNELSFLLNIIEERKKLIKSQVLRALQNIDKKLILNFDLRYENLIKSSKSTDKENIIISSLKVKGYKDSIKDILDQKVTLFPQEKNLSSLDILKNLKKKNKSSELLLNKLNKHRKTVNEFKFNKKKNNIRLIKDNLESRELLSKMLENKYNLTPNTISTSKTSEYNFLSFQNSNKYGEKKLINFDNGPKNILKLNKKESNNTFEKNFIFNNKKILSPPANIKGKLIIKRKMFPDLKNEHLLKSQSYFDIINRTNKTDFPNLNNDKKINMNNRNKSEKVFDIFKRINKNFFKGENFLKKLKIISLQNGIINSSNFNS